MPMAIRGAGTLLLIEVAEAAWSAALGRTIERFRPAGFVFRKLISPEATLEACRESARMLDALPFTVIEEEGEGALAALFPALPRLSTLQGVEVAAAADLIGRAMAALGLNLNLAPTLDIETPAASVPQATPTGRASADPSPVDVARGAEAFVAALSSQHVLCCGRHFPGLPLQKAIPAKAKAIVVDRSLAALWREDLVPYRALGRKLAAVEISPAVHRAYDYEFLQPASHSSGVIEGLLRAKLRYQGLALADASLAAQAAGIEVEEAVIRAVAAGCDLVMLPGEPRLIANICQSLEHAVSSGRVKGDRVAEAAARVKVAQKSLRRSAKRPASAQYSRLARDWEQFAQNLEGRPYALRNRKRP